MLQHQKLAGHSLQYLQLTLYLFGMLQWKSTHVQKHLVETDAAESYLEPVLVVDPVGVAVGTVPHLELALEPEISPHTATPSLAS